jgi:biopolymer transport protein ExbD
VPTLDGCYPWQPGGCEWTIRYLWRWMSSFGRLDVILLALMLIYIFTVVIYVYCRYYLARPAGWIASTRTGHSRPALNIELGGLKSIAITAPYLGLAGTCEGILTALGGGAMEKHAFMAMITTRMALALVPTTAAIPVAILAICSYNSLCTRIDLLLDDVFYEQQRGRHFRGARRFPPTKRFSELPAFGLLAAPALAFVIAAYMTFASFNTPKGFYVELASAGCEYDAVDRLIVLHITDTGKLFLNLEEEDRTNLASRLSAIYSMRQNRTLYLVADAGVPFQTVADALETVENIASTVGPKADGMKKDKLDIKVRLVTPKVFDAGCVMTS